MNKSKTPISVVLPVFNGGKYLPAAISSVLAQSFSNFEFIIINDGSVDDTGRVISKFAGQDSRIVVIERENRGLVASLNEGVARAQSDLIARMDADDIAMPDRLHTQLSFLNAHPECICVGSDIEIMDEVGRKLVIWRQHKNNNEIQHGALQGHGTICHPSAMFRKNAFYLCGGYRQEMYPAEDLDLWLRLGEIGELANVDQILLRYRMLPQSISGQAAKDGRQRAAAKRACDAACMRRGFKEPLFEAAEPWRADGTDAAALKNNLLFGWWAYSSREFGTATAYGWQAWRSAPTSRQALALFGKSLMARVRHWG